MQLAEDLGIAGREAFHGLIVTAEDVNRSVVRKATLEAWARACGIDLKAEGLKKTADIADAVANVGKGRFVPPSLRFGPGAEIAKSMQISPVLEDASGPKGQAAPDDEDLLEIPAVCRREA